MVLYVEPLGYLLFGYMDPERPKYSNPRLGGLCLVFRGLVLGLGFRVWSLGFRI